MKVVVAIPIQTVCEQEVEIPDGRVIGVTYRDEFARLLVLTHCPEQKYKVTVFLARENEEFGEESIQTGMLDFAGTFSLPGAEAAPFYVFVQ